MAGFVVAAFGVMPIQDIFTFRRFAVAFSDLAAERMASE
jgi:hypothetical protein